MSYQRRSARSLAAVPIVHIPVPDVEGPAADTPDRTPGSARRTSHVDVDRGGSRWGGQAVITGTARDIVTPLRGEPLISEATLTLRVDGPTGSVLTVDSDPPAPALQALVGVAMLAGFRRAVTQALPDQTRASTLLYRLLDDAPLAFLVSGHAMLLDEDLGPRPEEGEPPGGGRRGGLRTVDLCAGWQQGGALLRILDQTGGIPHSLGPLSPQLGSETDPLSWHQRPVLGPKMTRRTRRLDVVPGRATEAVDLDVHFRDSYGDLEGQERSVHEYTLDAEVDPTTQTIRSAVAVPRALPWTECPQAAGSAGRLVGLDLRHLPDLVRKEMTGITTCTHLNDTMRSLADASALLTRLAQVARPD
jgi:hypothetical protein